MFANLPGCLDASSWDPTLYDLLIMSALYRAPDSMSVRDICLLEIPTKRGRLIAGSTVADCLRRLVAKGMVVRREGIRTAPRGRVPHVYTITDSGRQIYVQAVSAVRTELMSALVVMI